MRKYFVSRCVSKVRNRLFFGAVTAWVIFAFVPSSAARAEGEVRAQNPGPGSSESAPSIPFEKYAPARNPVTAAQQIFLYQVIFVASGSLYGNSPLGWGDPTLESWYENVSQVPEYPDGDGWFLNYVGHPIMGAHMYIFARHQGYKFYEAFGFSTMGSLVWEYAFEGPFERVSTSDMLVTSTLGSVFGEALYFLYRKIDRSKAGSKWYGKAAKLIIHPFYMF